MRSALNLALQTLVAGWLGLSVFFTFAVGTAFFSEPVYAVFRQAGADDPKHYSGMMAMLVLQRYFVWQHVFGLLALGLLFGERFMAGRFRSRLVLALTLILVGLGGLGGWFIQPKLHELHRIKYAAQSLPADRAAASRQFAAWHGFSQMTNLGVLAGLGVLCWRLRPKPASHAEAT